ncbi:MAG: plastocyanin/azurin family copper-binding protein [Haloferacaceae archaeon]
MRRRRFLAALGAAGIATVGGCATTGALGSGGGDYDVGMRAVAFDPAELTVSVGDEVVWRNTSSRGHSVTAYEDGIPDGAAYFASGGYDSESAAREAWRTDLGGNVTSGNEYAHRFETPGTFNYFCIPHERGGMVGRVVVEA